MIFIRCHQYVLNLNNSIIYVSDIVRSSFFILYFFTKQNVLNPYRLTSGTHLSDLSYSPAIPLTQQGRQQDSDEWQ